MTPDQVTTHELVRLAAISYRQGDYWSRAGHLLTINGNPGHGFIRTHPSSEVDVAICVRRLLQTGFRDLAAAFSAARGMENGWAQIGEGLYLFDVRA